MNPVPVLALLGLTATTAVGVGVVTSSEPSDTARVVRVIDGDTFLASVGGGEQTIRLLNVDTPETKDPGKPVECMGPEATAFLQDVLPVGSTVTLRYDQDRTDKYGRTLAGVFAHDSLLNAEIARRGLGTAMKVGTNDRWFKDVDTAQDVARSQTKGLYDPSVSCTATAQVERVVAASNHATSLPTGSTSADAGVTLAALTAAVDAGNALEAAMVSPAGTGGTAWTKLTQGDLDSMRKRLVAARVAASTRKEAVAREIVQLQQQEQKAAQAAADAAEAARETTETAAAAAAAATRQADSTRSKASSPQAPKPTTTPSPQDSTSKSGPTANPYPGYTGPRCYAPGGKTWKPC